MTRGKKTRLQARTSALLDAEVDELPLVSAIPLIPARGKAHATRRNNRHASETASSKAVFDRTRCEVAFGPEDCGRNPQVLT